MYFLFHFCNVIFCHDKVFVETNGTAFLISTITEIPWKKSWKFVYIQANILTIFSPSFLVIYVPTNWSGFRFDLTSTGFDKETIALNFHWNDILFDTSAKESTTGVANFRFATVMLLMRCFVTANLTSSKKRLLWPLLSASLTRIVFWNYSIHFEVFYRRKLDILWAPDSFFGWRASAILKRENRPATSCFHFHKHFCSYFIFIFFIQFSIFCPILLIFADIVHLCPCLPDRLICPHIQIMSRENWKTHWKNKPFPHVLRLPFFFTLYKCNLHWKWTRKMQGKW